MTIDSSQTDLYENKLKFFIIRANIEAISYPSDLFITYIGKPVHIRLDEKSNVKLKLLLIFIPCTENTNTHTEN